jgi:orotidine-5'-phosphate decarboxylase
VNFRQKLVNAQHLADSWLCIGLDPDPMLMPDLPELKGPEGIAVFCRSIIEATSDIVCAFKPNLAFFLAHGSAGVQALEKTLASIPKDIPIVLDAKVGDIGSTQRHYGQAAFGVWHVDAMTVSPYVGEDAVKPLLEAFPDNGLYIVCRSSNPDSPRFQKDPSSEPLLYHRVAQTAIEWQKQYPQSSVGIVAGATDPEDLELLRKLGPDLPFLVPGVGAQGGSLDSAVKWGETKEGVGPLINVSRAVTYASRGSDYADTARVAAQNLCAEINELRKVEAKHD